MEIHIRQFRYTDVQPLIHIAQVSFAEEQVARGMTPTGFVRQARMVARGRMIPFKVLTALAGIKWGLFVAEVDGRVVGCGGYLGRKQMELAYLMVDPHYRRHGIGQALLIKRLHYLAELGHSFVTTTILASNQASLGNVFKQGFEIFDQYSIWETSLPLKRQATSQVDDLTSRPLQNSDRAIIKELEKQIAPQAWLQIRGSNVSSYFLSLGGGLLNRLTGTQRWSRAFMKNGPILGFLTASTSKNQNKGVLARPIITDANLEYLPAMLQEASLWLTQSGKMAMQVAVPDERTQLTEELQNSNWTKTRSWFHLVKRLDQDAGLNK